MMVSGGEGECTHELPDVGQHISVTMTCSVADVTPSVNLKWNYTIFDGESQIDAGPVDGTMEIAVSNGILQLSSDEQTTTQDNGGYYYTESETVILYTVNMVNAETVEVLLQCMSTQLGYVHSNEKSSDPTKVSFTGCK